MILRLLNWQGIAGIGVAFVLLVMLTAQKLESVRWKKASEQFEKLYHQEQAAFATTLANARAAADAARAADLANAQRVAAEQNAINQRSEDEFESRLADARARAERLRNEASGATARGSAGATPVPGLPASAGGTDQAAGEDRFPDALIATEQAIQRDELIKWVRAQAKVDNNGASGASSVAD
jgi:hypothetical protein